MVELIRRLNFGKMKNTLLCPIALVLFFLLAATPATAQDGLVIHPQVAIGDTTQ